MFELREIYAAAGFHVVDWRRRYDDHLVLQLHYLRHSLTNAAPQGCFLRGAVDPKKLAIFIDEHIGYWLPDWAQRVSLLCRTPFYAALAELSYVWLVRCRALLAELHNLPVPDRTTLSQRIGRKLALDKAEIAPIRFMPGAQGPSW
jgi:TorA maturation chaperone TorD